MKKLLLAAALSAFCFSAAYADSPKPLSSQDKEVTKASPKQKKVATKGKSAEEVALSNFKKKYPATQVTSLTKSEIDGIYEVILGQNIAYTDVNAKFLIFGHVFDMSTQTDLTQARLDEMNKVDFAKLPLEKAIKVVKGDGSRVFAVFTDPDCPFCKRLEESVSGSDVNNYTMYIFEFPIAGLHPEAESHANAIWCAKDRAAAWHNFLLSNKLPDGKADCATPIQDLIALGQNLNVQGTPTLFRADGMRMPGAMPGPQLNAWLDGKKVQMGR